MITNEQHEEFLKQVDDHIDAFKEVTNSLFDDSIVEFAINKFCMIRLGRELPIKWVKQGDSVKEFYPADLNLSWLITYINYYNEFLTKDEDTDLVKIKHSCLFLGLALSKIRGINIIDNTVYLLKNDLEFVDYKLNKQIFI